VKLGPAASGLTEKRRARHEKTTNQIQSEKAKENVVLPSTERTNINQLIPIYYAKLIY
jgi:hypothetical protein